MSATPEYFQPPLTHLGVMPTLKADIGTSHNEGEAKACSPVEKPLDGNETPLASIPSTAIYCVGPGGAGICGGCGGWTYWMYSRPLRAFSSSVGPAIA